MKLSRGATVMFTVLITDAPYLFFSSSGCVWTIKGTLVVLRFLPPSLPKLAVHSEPFCLWLLHLPQKEVLWFWSHGCWSARPVPFVWSGLIPVGRATFIGRCPLGLPWWSLGVVCHGGALLVLLLLLFHLLDDLPDFPLCSLWQRRRVCL